MPFGGSGLVLVLEAPQDLFPAGSFIVAIVASALGWDVRGEHEVGRPRGFVIDAQRVLGGREWVAEVGLERGGSLRPLPTEDVLLVGNPVLEENR